MNLLPPHFHLLQNQFTTHPHSHIHIYPNKQTKPHTKIPHITLLTHDLNQTQQYILMKFQGTDN
ncbi:hypothetical protein [Staphylococcus epidermidis]|uniref:hypothetical protein n=1 Tax=Staphylococcus epidermidis TaxID=1282 RepID=UPI0037DA4BA4